MVISARIQCFVGCEMNLKNPCRISRFISSRINGNWSRFKFWNTDSSWSKLYIFTWVCRLTSKITKTILPTKYYSTPFSIGGFWVPWPTWSHPSLLKSNHFEPKAIMAPKCVWRQKVRCIINLPGSIQLASEQILGSQQKCHAEEASDAKATASGKDRWSQTEWERHSVYTHVEPKNHLQ